MSSNKNNDNGIISGIVLIAIGVVALLVTLFDLELIWSEIWDLWPVVLIVLGISIMPFNKMIKSIAVIVTILVSCLIYYNNVKDYYADDEVMNIYYEDEDYAKDVDIQEFSEDFKGGVSTASIDIEYGAGELRLNPPVEQFIKATNASNDINIDFSLKYEGDHADIDFDVRDNINTDVKININGKDVINNNVFTSNHFNLALNEAPIYDFDISLGACDLNYDLTPYKVSEIDVDAGACKIDLKLGNLNTFTDVNIETGVSSIKIGVPKSSACRIECESVMTNKGFDGFEKKSSGIYETDNYYSATEKININLSGAITDVKIYRY